jgi:hypothetical protein
MYRTPADPYVEPMGILRRRAVLAALCALTAIGLVVVALPNHHDPAQALGTEGPATTESVANDVPALDAPAPGDAPAEEFVTSDSPATTVKHASTTTTTAAAAGTTTTTTAAPTTTTTVPAPLHDLRGRIVFHEYEMIGGQFGPLHVRSMLPDGSDRREVPVSCPAEQLLSTGLDVSPDGRHIVRSCGGPTPPVDAGAPYPGGYGLVIQAVDGSESRTILPLDQLDLVEVRWSPDGNQIALTSVYLLHPVATGIRIIDIDTGAVRTIQPPPGFDVHNLSWSPDGTRLLSRNGLVLDLATETITDLTPLVEASANLLVPIGMPLMGPVSIQNAGWAPNGLIYFTEAAGDATPPDEATSSFDFLDPATGAVARLRPGVVGQPDFLGDGRIVTNLPQQPLLVLTSEGVQQHAISVSSHALEFVSPRGAGFPTTG